MNKLGNVSVGGANPVRIMGILNTSPESFYKKTIVTKTQSQIKLIRKIVDEGAHFIDVGGMSTAPYLYTLISEKIESRRIIQVIKKFNKYVIYQSLLIPVEQMLQKMHLSKVLK